MTDVTIFRIGEHTLPTPKYARFGDAGLDLAACLAPVTDVNGYNYASQASDPSEPMLALTLSVTHTERSSATLHIPARHAALIPTGFAYQLPPNHEGQVRPRSSSPKYGYLVANSPGTIDESYHGEILAWVLNLRDYPLVITHGQRFCQLVISPVAHTTIREGTADQLRNITRDSERGNRGFGSTGK